MTALETNCVLYDLGTDKRYCELLAELGRYYRVPHVRFVVRIRVMCQAERAHAAGARSDIAPWLCKRAPLWVVVQVCALLRCR
jgi:hypothetical protein